MRLMVIGSGGREHAIVTYLAKNPDVEEIFTLPGNAGTAEISKNADVKATDIAGMVKFAKDNDIDFAFIAPDDPLVLGAADSLTEAGILCFGPTAAAAAIEGSKSFAKQLMKKYHIPTADFEVFDDYDKALAYIISENSYPAVIKADGLALGKGVTIAADRDEAEKALYAAMKDRVFGISGDRVVVERFMTGPEVSVLCFTDGNVIRPMVSAMDHKPAYDGNLGPNTGGMGAVAPNRHYTAEIAAQCMEEIFVPTMKAMNSEGRTFKGCLFFGLMLTPSGPRVVEYNCRFGDPETQAVLPLLETDLLTIVKAIAESKLADIDIKFSDRYSCCVVAASDGYPVKYETGKRIEFPASLDEDVYVFHAGTRLDGNEIVSSGGRVAGVTAVADTPEEARQKAYGTIARMHFDNIYYRKDIGTL